jgi:NAD(P)-dependent dehydrogenase (short-subunit alcohol dehydrogenase family)
MRRRILANPRHCHLGQLEHHVSAVAHDPEPISPSRGVAKRAAGTGVTVNAVLPGPTLSEGVEAMLKDAAGRGPPVHRGGGRRVRQGARPSSIIRRAATAEEVANLVVYVASPQASATTGAALRVDGGVVDTIV